LAGCAGKVPIHALALSNHGTSASVSPRTAGGTELAEPQRLFLPATHKHIRVLEGAGMVRRRKTGRPTYLALRREPLGLLQAWVGQLHPEWGTDQESLVNHADHLERRPTVPKEPQRTSSSSSPTRRDDGRPSGERRGRARRRRCLGK